MIPHVDTVLHLNVNIILEMTVDILRVFCGLCLVALIGQEQQCESTKIHSATEALEIYIEDWFPRNIKFNESCVAEGCPALKNISLCPNTWEMNTLRNITDILNQCMKGPVCGIIADARPLKKMLVSMKEFLPGVKIEGNLTLPHGMGYLTNISNMQFDIPSNEDQQLSLQKGILITSLRLHGGVQLDFSYTALGSNFNASLRNTTYDTGIEFITTVFVNKTTNRPYIDVKFVNPIVRARPRFCGIDLPSGFPAIQSLFTATAQMSLQNSSLAKAKGKFLEKLHRAAIQVVANNCKLFNSTM